MLKILREVNKFQENHKKPKRILPILFFFSNRHQFSDIFQEISKLNKESAIIIREYDLNFDEKLNFIKKVKIVRKNKGFKLFIGKNLELAIKSRADGVHFSDKDSDWRKYLLYKKNHRKFLLSCSCHNEKSLRKAIKLGIDIIFISPIFYTNSHPNSSNLGIEGLRRILKVKNLSSKIYALGGINDKNIKKLSKTKISGVGGISIISQQD